MRCTHIIDIVVYKGFCFKKFLVPKPIRIKKPVRGNSSSANSSKSLPSRGTRDSGPRWAGLQGCGAPDLAGFNSGFGDSPPLSVLWANMACFGLDRHT